MLQNKVNVVQFEHGAPAYDVNSIKSSEPLYDACGRAHSDHIRHLAIQPSGCKPWQTLKMDVFIKPNISGSAFRIQFQGTIGTKADHHTGSTAKARYQISHVSIAEALGNKRTHLTDHGTFVPITFHHGQPYKTKVTIPDGSAVWSDMITMNIDQSKVYIVSFTSHPDKKNSGLTTFVRWRTGSIIYTWIDGVPQEDVFDISRMEVSGTAPPAPAPSPKTAAPAPAPTPETKQGHQPLRHQSPAVSAPPAPAPAPPAPPSITFHGGMDAKGVNYTVFSNACASQGQRLPTYDELCPKGPGHVPFGWTGKDKDMWTPVMEHYDMKTHTKNKWVQIGSKPDWAKRTCDPLSAYHTCDPVKEQPCHPGANHFYWPTNIMLNDPNMEYKTKGVYACVQDSSTGTQVPTATDNFVKKMERKMDVKATNHIVVKDEGASGKLDKAMDITITTHTEVKGKSGVPLDASVAHKIIESFTPSKEKALK